MAGNCGGVFDSIGAVTEFVAGITNGQGLMETKLNQKIYRSMMASMFSVSLAAVSLCGVADHCTAQTAKKITPDPYFSTLHQSTAQLPPSSPKAASFYQSAWEPPKTATASTPARQAKIEKGKSAAEVWSSVARKTTKPVTRIDFSRLNVAPPKEADVALPQVTPQPLKPVVAEAVAKIAPQFKPQALTPMVANEINTPTTQTPQDASEAIKTALAQSRSIIRQRNAKEIAADIVEVQSSQAAVTPAANVSPPANAKPLTPGKISSDFNMPKISAKLPSALPTVSTASGTDENVDSSIGVASKIATGDDDGSFVQQAAYQPQLGERLKKMVGGRAGTIQKPAPVAAAPVVAAPNTAASGSGVRVADVSSNYYDPNTTYTPQGEVYSPHTQSESVHQEQIHQEQPTQQQPYQEQTYQGESFENSRVLALVGGHPVFVGDMAFEVNQILEKHMKGAPQAAKDAQKGKLMQRLLQKYVDQKMLYVSTLDQLPEEADIDEILKQAEKTFNERALPDMMERSEVESVTKFDAILRSQGTSIRQMRRSWAKDQISKFFLQEKVKFNRQVSHLEMLDEYRSNYDQYAIKGKVRWEQIEIQPTKAGGRFAAKDKIEDIYDRLVHGGNFEAIAKKESHGFRAFKGGQYDWTSKGSLVNKEIDKSIFTLPQGRLSGVIETKTGFHIIRVIERVEDHHTPFTEAQVEIKKQLLEARRDKAFKTYIDGLSDKINVEYVNE